MTLQGLNVNADLDLRHEARRREGEGRMASNQRRRRADVNAVEPRTDEHVARPWTCRIGKVFEANLDVNGANVTGREPRFTRVSPVSGGGLDPPVFQPDVRFNAHR